MRTRNKISAGAAAAAAVTAIGLVGANPASAQDLATLNLLDVSSDQTRTIGMSFDDSGGATFDIEITSTWQRLSSTRAVLKSVSLEGGDFPRGDCLNIDLGFTSSTSWESLGNPMCSGETLNYSPGVTATASSGTVLGQLMIRTPDPADIETGGARWITLQINS